MREKRERNKLIIKEIIRGEYLVDIAKKYNISSAMVSKIKKRYLRKVEQEKAKEGIIKGRTKNKQLKNHAKRILYFDAVAGGSHLSYSRLSMGENKREREMG